MLFRHRTNMEAVWKSVLNSYDRTKDADKPGFVDYIRGEMEKEPAENRANLYAGVPIPLLIRVIPTFAPEDTDHMYAVWAASDIDNYLLMVRDFATKNTHLPDLQDRLEYLWNIAGAYRPDFMQTADLAGLVQTFAAAWPHHVVDHLYPWWASRDLASFLRAAVDTVQAKPTAEEQAESAAIFRDVLKKHGPPDVMETLPRELVAEALTTLDPETAVNIASMDAGGEVEAAQMGKALGWTIVVGGGLALLATLMRGRGRPAPATS